MVISHNIEANFISDKLKITNRGLANSSEKLAAGYRINRAADDAAGIAISEEMRAQIHGLDRASVNTEEAMSFCQVADGAMQELHDIVQRIRELSVQAADDTNTDKDRAAIQNEVNMLIDEVNRITEDTEYNTIKVFQYSANKVRTTFLAEDGWIPKEDVVNWGIKDILGANYISRDGSMSTLLDFSAGGRDNWVNSGKEINISAWIDGTFLSDDKAIEDYFSKKYGVTISTISTNANERISSGNVTIDLTYGNDVNAYGERLLEKISINDNTTNQSSTIDVRHSALGTSGMGTISNNKYRGAWIDFSRFGKDKDYYVQDLVGLGFNAVCGRSGCDRHFNIVFTDKGGDCQTNDGVKYSYDTVGSGSKEHRILTVDISDCVTGEDIVKHIMSAAIDATRPGQDETYDFDGHYSQLAYNKNDSYKLYIYDNTPSVVSTFESGLWIYEESPDGSQVRVPEGYVGYRWVEPDLNIQVGGNGEQLVTIEKPYLSARILGVFDVNVETREVASNAITKCDSALNILNMKRAKIGALSNRFEHAYDNNTNASENVQGAESRVRDLDMANEMVRYSVQNIIKQASQSILAQANESKNGILPLLSE